VECEPALAGLVFTQSLKEKLRTQLADPGIARRRYLPELVAAPIACRVVELGMVEDIEKFGTDLKGH
jgi:hypothetical protein